MWRCPSCAEQNEDQSKSCWKCQTIRPGAYPEEGGPEDSHLDLIVDPERPVPVSDSGAVQCPTCGSSFKVQRDRGSTRAFKRLESAVCPYCANSLTPEVLVRLASPRKEGPHAVTEVIFACPYCGKVLGVAP